MVLSRVWIASIGTPAAMRPMTGTPTVWGRLSPSATWGTRPRLPSITLGEKPRERCASGWGIEFGQPHDLHGARPMRQAADEAALLERGDQPMDAGFRLEVERLLHLVEGGRHAGLLQPLMDEHEKLFLLRCEHLVPFERFGLRSFDALTIAALACTNHEQFICSVCVPQAGMPQNAVGRRRGVTSRDSGFRPLNRAASGRSSRARLGATRRAAAPARSGSRRAASAATRERILRGQGTHDARAVLAPFRDARRM